MKVAEGLFLDGWHVVLTSDPSFTLVNATNDVCCYMCRRLRAKEFVELVRLGHHVEVGVG